jgi:hypothetical protein
MVGAISVGVSETVIPCPVNAYLPQTIVAVRGGRMMSERWKPWLDARWLEAEEQRKREYWRKAFKDVGGALVGLSLIGIAFACFGDSMWFFLTGAVVGSAYLAKA